MTRFAAGVVSALALTVGSVTAAAQGGAASTVSISVDGLKPGTQVEINIEISGAGAPSSGTAGAGGMLDMLANVGAGGKPHVQLTVHIGECIDGKVWIALVQSGADPQTIPPECKDRVAGILWLDRARHVTIHIATGTITVQNSGMGMGTKIAIGVGGAAAVGGGLAAGGGGSKSTPAATTPTPPTATTPTSTPTPTPTPTPAPAPTAPPFAFLVNKTYSNMVTRGRADCPGFSPSASTQLRFTNIDPQTGRGTFLHIHGGATTLDLHGPRRAANRRYQLRDYGHGQRLVRRHGV